MLLQGSVSATYAWNLMIFQKKNEQTFPSKISCFLLLISFFSSKSVDSSLYKIKSVDAQISCWIANDRAGRSKGGNTEESRHHQHLSLIENKERNVRTISHSRLVTLTWVRIWWTSFSLTAYSFSFDSAKTNRWNYSALRRSGRQRPGFFF